MVKISERAQDIFKYQKKLSEQKPDNIEQEVKISENLNNERSM